MKILTSTILALLAFQAQAITFNWSSSAQVSFGDSLVSALTPATYTATLVYLGSNGAWDQIKITKTGLTLADDEIKTGDTATSNSGLTGMQARNNSRFGGTFKENIGSTTSGGYTVAAGDTFGVFLTYIDADGKTWFNVSSSTYTLPATANDLTQNLSGTFAFASSKTELADGAAVSTGSGWVSTPVPEPSVALMGLLGLGMLIKRRRA